MEMNRVLGVVLILAYLVLVDSRKCKTEADCPENECCVISDYDKKSTGDCSKLRKEGSICSRHSDKMKSVGGKYLNTCPCEKDFICKDKNNHPDIPSKKFLLQCVKETLRNSSQSEKPMKKYAKRDADYDDDDAETSNSGSNTMKDKGDQWEDIPLQSEPLSDSASDVKDWEEDTAEDKDLRAMWENDDAQHWYDTEPKSPKADDKKNTRSNDRQERTTTRKTADDDDDSDSKLNKQLEEMQDKFGSNNRKGIEDDFDDDTGISGNNRRTTPNYEQLLKYLQKKVHSKDATKSGDNRRPKPRAEDDGDEDFGRSRSRNEDDWGGDAFGKATVASSTRRVPTRSSNSEWESDSLQHVDNHGEDDEDESLRGDKRQQVAQDDFSDGDDTKADYLEDY